MSETADQMAPDASPGEVSKKSGVRRVNNVPMYLLGGVLGLFLLVMATGCRGSRSEAERTGHRAEGEGRQHLDVRQGNRRRADGRHDRTGEAAHRAGNADRPGRGPGHDRPAREPGRPAGPAGLAASECSRCKTMKPAYPHGEAANARRGGEGQDRRSGGCAPRSSGSTPGGRTPATGAPQSRAEMLARLAEVQQQIDAQRERPDRRLSERLAQLRGMGVGGRGRAGRQLGRSASLLQTSANAAGGKNYAQFAGTGGDRWKLDSQPEAPRSPFELRAGFVVPATLISGINSDLPGQIMAQVAKTCTTRRPAKHLLIPQGSRLVGSYSSDVPMGNPRAGCLATHRFPGRQGNGYWSDAGRG
jgi:type IV secretory pathway VirB10-like protein